MTIAASLYVSGTRRGAETELFLASLGLGSLDLKPPRFFVQTPRTRRGSFFTGSWSPLVAVHRTRAPWLLPSAFRPRVSEMSCDCSEASRTVPWTGLASPRLLSCDSFGPRAETLPQESSLACCPRERLTSSSRGLAWRFKSTSVTVTSQQQAIADHACSTKLLITVRYNCGHAPWEPESVAAALYVPRRFHDREARSRGGRARPRALSRHRRGPHRTRAHARPGARRKSRGAPHVHARRLGAIPPPSSTRRDRRHQRPTFRPPIHFVLLTT